MLLGRNLALLLLVLLAAAAASAAAQDAVIEETVADAPLSPLDAARTMRVPAGFQVTLFAGEPDVRQPIGFCIDDRGRLWVAEAYNYPNHGEAPRDRVLILEDVDNDGRFDKRTLFYDRLGYVTGIEVGFGGAWVMSPPELLFIPDRDGDDRPDGEPEVVLDGFGNHANAHNLANGFAWGPDGWLYGTHGRTNWSMIGAPGTPQSQRVRFDGGVYRYHPVRKTWEPYADGTTNPWGIDWDDYGEAFISNCVNPHLFHVILGAHYEPWRNRESSRHAYRRIDTIADHLHFLGHDDVREGIGTSVESDMGGGHAHCGVMVYLGDNWPEEFRNCVFMNNIHGKRINRDRLARRGSGYQASHEPDVMLAADPWFMGVSLQYGPDGAVYCSDWSDTGECHSLVNTRRETGRIYKVSYGQPKKPSHHLASASDLELVTLQLADNDWWVRHARRLLQERAAAGKDMTGPSARLIEILDTSADVKHRLRALWALHAIGAADEQLLHRLLADRQEHLRSWAVRLLCESPVAAEGVARLARLAHEDGSPLVRLHLASNLQRLPFDSRWEIARGLVGRKEDAQDANLPLMIWYGIEPLMQVDARRFASLAGECELPVVRRHIARRVASQAAIATEESDGGEDDPFDLAVKIAADSPSTQVREDLIGGMAEGLAGQRRTAMPPSWPLLYARCARDSAPELHQAARQLALVFGDSSAIEELKAAAADARMTPALRVDAIEALAGARVDGTAPLLLQMVSDPAVRGAALRGLAEYADPSTPEIVLAAYDRLDSASRQDAVQTLASREPWALALLEAVRQGRVPRSDITAYSARQMQSLGSERVSRLLDSQWGALRPSQTVKEKQIADYKKRLGGAALATADRSAGRAVFEKTCARCHKLFGAGGDLGPDITGAQRSNLDYLLDNVIDPSRLVARDYQLEILEMASGRIVTGLVEEESDTAVTLRTINERVVAPKDEIEARAVSSVSIMPDGLLSQLSLAETRALFAYLMGSGQVELPSSEADAGEIGETQSPGTGESGLETDGKIEEDSR